MEKLPRYSYDHLRGYWNSKNPETGKTIGFGMPTPNLVKRAQLLTFLVMEKLRLGLSLNDIPDIPWYDRFWDITDDGDLLSRVQEVLEEWIMDGGRTKENKELVKEMYELEINGGELRKFNTN